MIRTKLSVKKGQKKKYDVYLAFSMKYVYFVRFEFSGYDDP